MLSKVVVLLVTLSISVLGHAKEVALSFDDAPVASSLHFSSSNRTSELIRKLKAHSVPPVMVFANACKGQTVASMQKQLGQYVEAGHSVQNHTCSHPRFDSVGFKSFSEDLEKGEMLLKPLLRDQKFFRFPYLNEGTDPVLRDQMRDWLKANGYRNASITGDNEDPTFSAKMNEAKRLGKKIDYRALKEAFLDHVVSALECNDSLAVETLGRSPKHVLLLHEVDATVMFVDSLILELRKRGWKIISAEESYTDSLYQMEPKNTHSGFGIIAQIAYEKTGMKKTCYDYSAISKRLDSILNLN